MGHPTTYDEMAEFILQNKENYYRLAYSYVRSREDALDIVQEAIVRAFSSRKTLKDTASMKSWFYRIIINTALDFLRKNKKYTYLDEEQWEGLSSGPGDTYEDVDLHKALDKLSPKNRTIIILRFFEDMKLSDIARILGENENTVKTSLYSTLKKLRLELTEDMV
ncbi:RNA polymerase sigma factor [Anaerocolumna xylanovorans]|uniref:RNA polymerase sigma factor n=1 Tax=Anaerocolumna xylanovorans DSM 12503 TaxID=1121345 RepID=A0A1M7Y3A7_9FIRM|nr:RNA polymerase sigma factor [Anaerocolumna xylanovorans]SHO46648.1 RNA polymerase, sigma subunit, SigV [Anaerocolumna xylanovorans DSM 12503]